MNKIVLALLFTFCLGAIVGSSLVVMRIVNAKNSGYIGISGQTYKLLPVKVTYVENVK